MYHSTFLFPDDPLSDFISRGYLAAEDFQILLHLSELFGSALQSPYGVGHCPHCFSYSAEEAWTLLLVRCQILQTVKWQSHTTKALNCARSHSLKTSVNQHMFKSAIINLRGERVQYVNSVLVFYPNCARRCWWLENNNFSKIAD